MMRRVATAAFLGITALASAVPADAQSRDMRTLWFIQPAPVPQNELVLAGGDFVLKQRLLPSGLAELKAEAALGSHLLPVGTQLVEIKTDGARVYCSADVTRQKLIGASFQPCLVDQDADGDFDGWFNAISQTKGLLSIGGKRPKKPKAIAESRYDVVQPEKMHDEYFVAIERRNFFNIYGKESFTIAFGKDGNIDRITSPISFKTAELPRPLTILGARFTALSESDGRMRIKVDEAMPMQPFGIVTTTTYRIY